MSEILRGLPGSSLVNAPADTDFADPEMATELEDAFGGAATLRCNERRSCSLPGTKSRLGWTDGRRFLSSTPAVDWRHGVAGCGPGLKATMSWPTAYRSLSTWICHPWI